jgi:predicted Fe-Mo cluster-binding NifX family protein
MLILIGSDKKSLESPIAKRFGHANYYILFNSESQSFRAFENNDEGHNHENLRNFLDKGVEVFIVGNIGPYAFEIINTKVSKVYLARKMLVRDAIEKYIKGELMQLSEPTVKKSMEHKHHSHRHRHGKAL